jgi:sugar lactone lactonase YvrE
MDNPDTLLTGLALGESPRWHEGRLWLADWPVHQIAAVDLAGTRQIIADMPPSFPISFDWLPDGTMLATSNTEHDLLRVHADGRLERHADLSGVADVGINEIVIDGRGDVFVNSVGFDMMAGEAPKPGIIAVVTRTGNVRKVAGDVMFPNGMVVTPDNSTLIVAESYANQLTAFDIDPDAGLSNQRVWAHLGDGVPDGLTLDADGAVWYADVPNQRCVRVAEGGAVLDTVEVDLGCFACMLGGPDGRTLFIVAAEWTGPDGMTDGKRTGVVLTTRAPAAHTGWP